MNRRTLINQLSAALLAGVVSLTGVSCADADQATAQDRGLVLVAGATGRTGRLVVSNLLEQGYPVRALVRDMERGHEILGDGVEFSEGDVRDIDSLRAAMQGAASLIITIGSSRKDPDNGPEFVDYGGVKNLAEAAADTGVQQVVLMSSAGVTHEDHVLNQMFNNVLIWKSRGEDALRDSGVDYTIVRPGGLMDSPGGETAVVFEQGDSSTGMISREDVALVCIAALQAPAARNKTFEVFGSEEQAPNDWTNLYSDLQSDNQPNG
jgi:uncharacterized protein YbjT (DUF2867 family)